MMKRPSILLVATGAVAALASARAAPPRAASPVASVQQLYGHWQVVGVAVSGDGAQALSPNDPSYMGRRLTFSAGRLSWDKPAHASTEAACNRPQISVAPRDPDPDARAMVRKVGGPALRAFAVACASGTWGPNTSPTPTLLALRDGTIALWWFDNGLLKLRRVGESSAASSGSASHTPGATNGWSRS